MGTPTYQGAGQPSPDSGVGWLGQLGSFLGGGATPAYAGDGQPSSSGAGFFGSSTPAYGSALSSQPPSTQADLAACPIDTDALAAGQIAIVVPRNARNS